MLTTRRRFLALCAGAAHGPWLALGLPENPSPAAEATGVRIRCLDYGRSFVGHTGSENSVRFWIESRTTIIDQRVNTSTDYYQCASCKSENTFAERDLFKEETFDFLPVIGGGHVLIFLCPAGLTPKYRDVRKQVDVWGRPEFLLHDAQKVTILDTWEKIHDATKAGLPLVSQTEIANAELGLRAVIQCPVTG